MRQVDPYHAGILLPLDLIFKAVVAGFMAGFGLGMWLARSKA